ncbi:LuxR C-terminal-related transcriptional regulator [Streptomyces sp. NEAU-Y11]|uniref:LuxR C-terminal-related transcriptional regulator n=1 Tax=Streptomyces cucumeris TaxID=2962890 RepID=UPI0027E58DF0|nr:LuxR C-terminal-related transcriptional regulator [Streptomyces sp. NEAU-Y11]
MNDQPWARSRRDVAAALTSGVSAALTVAHRGASAFVLTGDVGAGKSHSLREVLARVTAPRRLVRVGTLTARGPYAVVCELLGADHGPTAPRDAEERLLARLDALCAAGPLVLAVDDVHEADAASLAVLNLIASAAEDLPLALVVTRRPRPRREHLERLLRRPSTQEVPLPPLDEIDLDALVHEQTGRWPTPGLRAALLAHRENALRVTTLLDDLSRGGALLTGTHDDHIGLHSGPDTAAALRPGLDEAVAAGIRSLRGPVRQIIRVLAVMERPVTPEELASVGGVSPVAVVEPVQTLLDRGLVAFDPAGRVAFTHDSYRDAVARAIPPALRRVLHTAAADHEASAHRVRHIVASGAPPERVLSALEEAGAELADAPAVEADLLADPPETWRTSTATVELAVRRSRALARSGQMRRAEEVARSALTTAIDPAQTVELSRALIFALTVQGKTSEALALIDRTPFDTASPRVHAIMEDHRRQLSLLGGLRPLPLRPPVDDPLELTLTGLVTEALRLCLTGSPRSAVELAWEASRRHRSAEVDPYEGSASDVWPPFVEAFLNGPRTAEAALREVERLREERAAQWQAAPHQLLSAAIAMSAGRLDEAAATFDAGLDLAETGELAWTSMAVGARALIDVLRGEPDAAGARLDRWKAGPRVLQFGIPQPARAEVALLEARRRYADAARLAHQVRSRAAEGHHTVWLATIAPELGRVALRAADDRLRTAIAQDIERLPAPLSPALVPSVLLARALTAVAHDETAALAAEAAEAASDIGEALVEMAAWEEAAVAAAHQGHKDDARHHARSALRCADRTGAVHAAARLASRLRTAGVRLGSTAGRVRPATGWEALTPTEAQVAEQVRAGLSGPDIARRMHISPRTVQTHVSHVLAKLGLSSRVELAAAAAARAAGTPPGPVPVRR